MATRMKVWLGTLAVAFTLVATWALPPASVTRLTRRATPEEVRYREVTNELLRAHRILVAHRWSDSLTAFVVEQGVDVLALAYPPSEGVSAEGFQEWRQRLGSHMDSIGPLDPDMKLGFVFQDDRHGALEGVLGPSFGLRTQIYTGVLHGDPYCFVVAPERYPVSNGSLRAAQTLEQCDWYAKYGVPGVAIGRWLEAGGFMFAMPGRVEDLASVPQMLPDDAPFGIVRPFAEPIAVAACLAGDATSCERAVTDPAVLGARIVDPVLVAESPMSFMASGYRTPFQRFGEFLLSEWEARYGRDAFARFWKSSEPMPVAFEAAFGTELGPWMRDWTRERVGSFRAGPAPRAASLGWTFALVLLLSGYVSLRQTRRELR